MKVTLRFKSIANGKKSLFLDVTGQGRQKEYLKMFIHTKPKNAAEKLHNEETLRQANTLASKRQLEYQGGQHGLDYAAPTSQTFESFLKEYAENYPNTDRRKFTGLYSQFVDFAGGKPFFLSQNSIDRFRNHLKAKTKGETPSMYFRRFKRVCILAYKERIIKADPAKLDWSIKFDRSLRKEVLTNEELQILANTPCGNESVRRLFLFCCNTGLRFGDARDLTWKDLRNWQIKIEQGKTGRLLDVGINDNAKAAAGLPGLPNEKVFANIKSAEATLKVIENWYRAAKIEKHITTHCARHTFCTNLMKNKVDYRTIIALMGWSESSGMRQIMRYAHLVNENLKTAVDSLKGLEF